MDRAHMRCYSTPVTSRSPCTVKFDHQVPSWWLLHACRLVAYVREDKDDLLYGVCFIMIARPQRVWLKGM